MEARKRARMAPDQCRPYDFRAAPAPCALRRRDARAVGGRDGRGVGAAQRQGRKSRRLGRAWARRGDVRRRRGVAGSRLDCYSLLGSKETKTAIGGVAAGSVDEKLDL